jgi:hypothetical protein
MEANRPSSEHVPVAGSMNDSFNCAKEINDEEQRKNIIGKRICPLEQEKG